MFNLHNLKGKKVVVLGLARSGVAAARLLASAGVSVIVNDGKPSEELTADLGLLSDYDNITFIFGSHPVDLIDEDVTLIVKNPGIPMNLPLLSRAKELGIAIISEVELSSWIIEAQIVAITGTNGKTTTTALTGEMFKIGGRKTHVTGNIGIALSEVVKDIQPDDVVVVEMSSFQLESTIDFHPSFSAILNITPDHMDRHGNLEDYRQAKAKIFANQSGDDVAVLNADDPDTFILYDYCPARIYLFSRKREVQNGCFLRNGRLILRDENGEVEICSADEIAIPGAHNLENAMAASLLAWLGGVNPTDIAQALKTFKGVPHRLEFVRTFQGISFINDSKGTNTDAAVKALEAFQAPKVLIAGGYDKGGSFDSLALEIKKHVTHAVLIGQVRQRMAAALQEIGFKSFQFADTLEDAVIAAYQSAAPGDVVLLSPACASWDMFRNYEQRGELFKAAVQSLGG